MSTVSSDAAIQMFTLSKESELRIEVNFDATLRLELTSGTAEIFNIELSPQCWITFPPAHKFTEAADRTQNSIVLSNSNMGGNCEKVKKRSAAQGKTKMAHLPFHHDSVDLDDFLKETLPQLEEAVKEIDQQKEVDHHHIPLTDVQQRKKKKMRKRKENVKKKMKKEVHCPSASKITDGYGADSEKDGRCGNREIDVPQMSNGNQPSSPNQSDCEAAFVEAQERKKKHVKKKRKRDSEEIHNPSLSQTNGFDQKTDLMSEESNTEGGNGSRSVMSNDSQSQALTPEERWIQRQQYLALEASVKRLTFLKDINDAILKSLKASITHTPT